MTQKKFKLYTPRDDLTEFENFEELAKRIVRVKKVDADKAEVDGEDEGESKAKHPRRKQV